MGAGEWAIWAKGTGGAKTLRNVWETEWKPVRLEQSVWEGGDGWSQRQQDGSWVVLPEKYIWEGLFFYTIFIYFVCIACGILVPRTRDRTHNPRIGSATSQPQDHQGSPVWGLPPTVPGGSVSKESAANAGQVVGSLVRKIPWRRKWPPTPVFLPGNPMNGGAWWGCKELDTAQQLNRQHHRPPVNHDHLSTCVLTGCLAVFKRLLQISWDSRG